jgi:hypothetical protein
MYELKWVRFIPITIGIIFVLYGWAQTWGYMDESTFVNIGNQGIKSTIKSYVFVISGFNLIFIGVLLGAVMKYVNLIEERIYRELRDE